MSFGQNPPKTAYGDQDFIKEDFNPPPSVGDGVQQQPPVRGSTIYPSYNQNVTYSSFVPPQPSSDNLHLGPHAGPRQQPQQIDVANIVQSLTPEDQIFMRSWRRDSFFYRVLPISVIGSSALYFYNQAKNLPHKTSRYLLVSFGAYIIGKWSYKGELKRRLEASPSNTPFMKALKELMGVRSSFSDLDSELRDDIGQDFSVFGSSTDSVQQKNISANYAQHQPPISDRQSQVYGQRLPMQDPNYQPYESDQHQPSYQDDTTTKPMTSYEELRARNRGIIQK